MEATHCPVCGFGPFPEPYPSYTALGESYDICPCCFCEYGYDDTDWHREEWLARGASWHDSSLKPPDWSLTNQLEHAIEGWHGIRFGFSPPSGFVAKYQPRIDVFLRQLHDSDPQKRLSAISVLAWLDDPRIGFAIGSRLNDPDEDVAYLARFIADR